MNYKESKQILEEIKKAKKILLNCHRSPDGDSIGSALAVYNILMEMGKDVRILCPDGISREYAFLPYSEEIEQIDYKSFDFSDYDLFILLDSSVWSQVAGKVDNPVPNIKKIVIDHHHTNKNYGDINLVASDSGSTAEILYKIFKDWGVAINKDTANSLLTGIIYDTSLLQHPNSTVETVEIVADLMRLGADKDEIVLNLYKSMDFDKIKVIGEILSRMEFDRDFGFIWSALPNDVYSKYPDARGVKSMVANLYGSSVGKTSFGIIMIEEIKNSLNVSFRSRSSFDVSKVAEELGGGGHKMASAVIIDGLPFDEAVKKVLETARKYAKKNS